MRCIDIDGCISVNFLVLCLKVRAASSLWAFFSSRSRQRRETTRESA